MCTEQAFPSSNRRGYGCYSDPYQLFYAYPKVEENVQKGKSWGKDLDKLGLEIGGKQNFFPLNIGLSKENIVNYCPDAIKWL